MADGAERPFPVRANDEMPGRVRAKDWSKTALGPMESWSPTLRVAVDIILASGFPMALRWGPDFVFIYNDGYKSILGDKHPWALGLPTAVAWSEVWPTIEPMHRALLVGESAPIFQEDMLLRIKRHQGIDEFEDGRFTLAYSPAPDPTVRGGIGGVFVTCVETTERVKTERQLREAEEALRRLNETLEQQVGERTRERDRLWRNSQDLLLVIDRQGNFRAASPAWTRILGWLPEEVVGRHHLEFVHPDQHEKSRAALARASVEELPTVETLFRHKDGSYRWIAWVAAPEDDLVYASGRHVTEEKQAAEDLAVAQEALRQSQKMEAVGQLTGGIAHDFNNMLAIVMGSLDLATRRLQRGDAGVERYLENAREGAARAASLTQRLLAFSRQSPLAPRVTDLNTLVSSMSELLHRTLGERIKLETVASAGLWAANVDPNQLESAIVNLAVNARDAMPDGGKLTIEVGNVHLDDRYVAREIGVVAGQYVMIAVTDVGTGMPREVRERAFDPFYTTKPVGKGTGLGLSMVYGFAKQSGGHVRIYSELGQGTSIKIYLPRHFGSIEEAIEAGTSVAPHEGSKAETVLVVEDEERVRQMSIESLQELGYAVHAASSGEEALRVFDSLGPIDILFTDIVMGGMTGRQLADALKARAPHLKVLYTTGYTRNAVVHNGVLDHGVAFLPKPFSVADLAAKIRAVLDS
jgi:PAS domain S-box-containing protein